MARRSIYMRSTEKKLIDYLLKKKKKMFNSRLSLVLNFDLLFKFKSKRFTFFVLLTTLQT